MAKNEKEKSVSFPDGKNLEDERQKTLLMKDYEPPKPRRREWRLKVDSARRNHQAR